MKKYFATILTCLLVSIITAPASAQQSQATTQQVNDKQIKDANLNTTTDLINNVAAIVTLTDDQKTKLQSGLLDVVTKSEQARHAMKDDSKLQAWREQKIADIKAQLKAVLTPAQYEKVLKEGSN